MAVVVAAFAACRPAPPTGATARCTSATMRRAGWSARAVVERITFGMGPTTAGGEILHVQSVCDVAEGRDRLVQLRSSVEAS